MSLNQQEKTLRSKAKDIYMHKNITELPCPEGYVKLVMFTLVFLFYFEKFHCPLVSGNLPFPPLLPSGLIICPTLIVATCSLLPPVCVYKQHFPLLCASSSCPVKSILALFIFCPRLCLGLSFLSFVILSHCSFVPQKTFDTLMFI